MVLRHIQAGKVVVVVLDLGALVNLKAHTGEHVDDLILDEGDRVQAAGLANLGGHRDVDGLGGVAGLERGLFDLLGQGLILCLGHCLNSLMVLPTAGRSSLGTSRRLLVRPATSPFLLRYFCQKSESRALSVTSALACSMAARSSLIFSSIVHLCLK
mgnify:CR=1 FL=1